VIRAKSSGCGLWLIAVCGLFPETALPQAQDAGPQPVFRVSVDRIQIGAVVRDAHGHQVKDLDIADFTVYDGNQRQELTNCEYVELRTPASAGNSSGKVDPSAPPAPAGRQLSSDQVRRTVVFLIDDISFHATSIPAVRKALKEAIESGIQPGDMAAIIRTSSGNGSLEQFTSDKNILLESAGKVRWRPESRANPGLLPQVSGTVVGENTGQYLVLDSTNRTRAVLQYVIEALAGIAGRKAILLISESLLTGTTYFYPGGVTDVGRLVDKALRAGVIVYALDPTPLSSLTPDAGYDLTREYVAQNGGSGATMPDAREAGKLLTGYTSRAFMLLEIFRAGLRALAEGTGGRMAADTDPGNALIGFTEDVQGYYLLTYRPRSPERYFAAKDADPPFRTLRIRVSRSGLRVRSYAGYVATPDRPDLAGGPKDVISRALFSPFSASGLRVEVASLFTMPHPALPEIHVFLRLDAHDLSFISGAAGRHDADFDVVVRTSGEQSDSVEVTSKTVALRLTDRDFAEALQNGVRYRFSVPAKRPGLYEVRVAVRDTGSGQVGSAREFVEVPDLRKDKLAASGLLVYNERPRLGDLDAPGIVEVRRFRREDRLTYACQIFNGKSLGGQLRVVRDGVEVMTSQVEPVANGDGTQTMRGSLTLASFAPGGYSLQIVVAGVGGKAATVSSWSDFEILP